jgi:hypothetical protein
MVPTNGYTARVAGVLASSGWRFVPGTVLGLGQPAMLGELACARGIDVAALAAALRQAVDEPLPTAALGSPAALAGFAAGAIQRALGIAVGERFHVRDLGDARFAVALPVAREGASRAAMLWTLAALNRAAAGHFDAAAMRRRGADMLRQFAEPDLHRMRIVNAALRQDIPVHAWTQRYVLLGTGRHVRWTDGGLTDLDNSVGLSLAARRQSTVRTLRIAGLPGGPEDDRKLPESAGRPYDIDVAAGRVDAAPEGLHADNARLALDAVALLRLHSGRVHVILPDCTRSWLQTGAVITGVDPKWRPPADIDAMVRGWVGGGNGRIPATLFVVREGAAQDDAQVCRWGAGFDAVSAAAGLFVGGLRASTPFPSGLWAGRALLMRQDVGSAACVMTPAEIAAQGLPLDRWDDVRFADARTFAPSESEALETARHFIEGAAPP